MPRYYYPKLRPILKEFSAKNKLPFKVSGVSEIMMMNYHIIKRYSGEGKSILETHRSASMPNGPFEKSKKTLTNAFN